MQPASYKKIITLGMHIFPPPSKKKKKKKKKKSTMIVAGQYISLHCTVQYIFFT